MKQYTGYMILVLIILLGGFLRLYKLNRVPNGLYQDETAIAYNAYSISQTGKDEHGKQLPLYFESFGDYKLPVYIYTTVLSQKIFGVNAFSVRFPSALFGILTIGIFYFFSKEILNNTKTSLLSVFLLAINPWHIHYSRGTYEVSIVLFLLTCGTYCLIRSTKNKFPGALLLGTICFLTALYSYNLTRILSPILYIGILLSQWKQRKSIRRLEWIATTITIVVLCIPFVHTYSSNGGVKSASGTLLFSSAAVQAPLIEFRSYIADNAILNKFIFNSITLNGWQYITNLASYLSVPFFFLTGSSHGNHGIGTNGQFYLFELPFLLVGFLMLKKMKLNKIFLILYPLFATILIASLTRESPHATRSFTLLMSIPLLVSLGIQQVIAKIKTISPKLLSLFFVIFILYGSFSIILYMTSYWIRFPIFYAKNWRSADRDLGLYLKENESKYSKIIIDPEAGFIYTSLLFYLQFPPNQFQETVMRTEKDSEGFTEVLSFGKYEYKKVNWDLEPTNSNTLYITSLNNKPKSYITKQTFTYPKRPVVIALKQSIISYPVEDVAYVAFENLK